MMPNGKLALWELALLWELDLLWELALTGRILLGCEMYSGKACFAKKETLPRLTPTIYNQRFCGTLGYMTLRHVK
jgi:hypothetical protein